MVPKPSEDTLAARNFKGDENVLGYGNLSAVLSSAYLDEGNQGQLLVNQKISFKKQTASEQDVDQLPLDES